MKNLTSFGVDLHKMCKILCTSGLLCQHLLSIIKKDILENYHFEGGLLSSNHCLIRFFLPECEIEMDIGYRGNDITMKKVKSQEDCAKLCVKKEKCVVWTYTPKQKTCYVKKVKGKGSKIKGKVSGNRACGEE